MVDKSKSNGVAVVVLGDIGRSPRMQYHALSIAKSNETESKVSIVGYNESIPHRLIREQSNITIRSLKPFPAIPRLPLVWPFLAVFKVLFQILQLLYVLLFVVPRPLNTVIVQSPPAIPTTFVLQIVCLIRGTRLIIDWHNLGYTILQLSIKKKSSHPIIRLATFIERFFGRHAYAHLFVTEAMKNKLSKEWNLVGQKYVLHDKPAPIFKSMDEKERKEFLDIFLSKYKENITEKSKGFIERARDNKVAIAMSSTSWTPDEDFSILLDAIVHYDIALRTGKVKNDKHPDLLFFITGKGPQREMYEEKIKKLDLLHCHIMTVWLASEDYPKLLGCANVGVSLHQSSSGVDLPMKVVDMFGCCVPALAVNFDCLDELVKVGVNGDIFDDSQQLTQLFIDTLEKFPKSPCLLKLRNNLISTRPNNTWENEWSKINHLFVSPLSSKSKKTK